MPDDRDGRANGFPDVDGRGATPLEAGDGVTAGIAHQDASEPVGVAGSLWLDAWRQLRRRPMFLISGGLILIIIAMALFPSLFTGADPRHCLLEDSLLRASSEHWFGVDLQGCDYYAKAVYGTRVLISIGVTVAVFATAIALLGGSISGYYGGIVDTLIARLTDIWFVIPTLLGGIVILTLFGERGVAQVSLVLIVLGWPTMLRLVRSSVLTVKETDYVDAARGVQRYQEANHAARRRPESGKPTKRLQIPYPVLEGTGHPHRAGPRTHRAGTAAPCGMSLRRGRVRPRDPYSIAGSSPFGPDG